MKSRNWAIGESVVVKPGVSAIIEVREGCLPHHVAVIVWSEHWRRGKNDATPPIVRQRQ